MFCFNEILNETEFVLSVSSAKVQNNYFGCNFSVLKTTIMNSFRYQPRPIKVKTLVNHMQ